MTIDVTEIDVFLAEQTFLETVDDETVITYAQDATTVVLAGSGPPGPPGPPGPGGGIESIVAGANITVDATDPDNPIVATTGLATTAALALETAARQAFDSNLSGLLADKQPLDPTLTDLAAMVDDIPGVPYTDVPGNWYLRDFASSSTVEIDNTSPGFVRFNLADTAVAPDDYGTDALIPRVTVDAQGRITGASHTTVGPSALRVKASNFQDGFWLRQSGSITVRPDDWSPSLTPPDVDSLSGCLLNANFQVTLDSEAAGVQAGMGFGPRGVIEIDGSVSIQHVGENARTVTDAVITSSSTTMTAASAPFVSGDTGKIVFGVGIPPNTTITYVSATQVTLSQAATQSGTRNVAVGGSWAPSRNNTFVGYQDVLAVRAKVSGKVFASRLGVLQASQFYADGVYAEWGAESDAIREVRDFWGKIIMDTTTVGGVAGVLNGNVTYTTFTADAQVGGDASLDLRRGLHVSDAEISDNGVIDEQIGISIEALDAATQNTAILYGTDTHAADSAPLFKVGALGGVISSATAVTGGLAFQGNGVNTVPIMQLRRLPAGSVPVSNGDEIGRYSAFGFGTSVFVRGGSLSFTAAQDFTNAHGATDFALLLSPNNSVTPAAVVSVTSAGVMTVTSDITSGGVLTGTVLSLLGTTGSLTDIRLVGGTIAGAPSSGAHLVGDVAVDVLASEIYVCTAAGTPGTWAAVGNAGGSTFVDSIFRVTGNGDATKKVAFEVDTNVPTGTTVTLTVPGSSGTIVLSAVSQQISNKQLVADNTTIIDSADNTKKIAFDASGITTATTRTLTFPDSSGTFLVSAAVNQTVSGAKLFNNNALVMNGSTSGTTKLNASAVAGTTTITFPAVTDTVSVLGTAQTHTALKTFTAGISVDASNVLTLPAVTDTLAVVGTDNVFSSIQTFALSTGETVQIRRSAVPTSTQVLGALAFQGYSTGTTPATGASVRVEATENWNSSSAGSRMLLKTTPNGTLTAQNALILGNDQSSLFVGRAQAAQGVDVASANNLALGGDGNVFEITGTTQINLISNTNWQLGSMVTLIFTSTPTVKHNQTTSGSNIKILLAGAADFAATAGDTLTLVYSEQGGTNAWREVARAVI